MKKIAIIASYEEEIISDTVKTRVNRVTFEYVDAIIQTGIAMPYIIPCNAGRIAESYIQEFDAFVIPGGHDVDPSLYGEPLTGGRDCTIKNDQVLLDFIGRIIASGKPLLGICRGMQLLNVYYGGTLCQHVEHADVHDQYNRQYEEIHDVYIHEDSFLHRAFSTTHLPVNSLHHQAVSKLGRELKIVAESTYDGLPEAIEHAHGRPIYGVQWHPERLSGQQHLFDWFVQRGLYKERALPGIRRLLAGYDRARKK